MENNSTKESSMENGSGSDECFYKVLDELEELSKYKNEEAKTLVEKFKECRAKPKVLT